MALAKLVSKQKGRRFLKNLIAEELAEERDVQPLSPHECNEECAEECRVHTVRASSMYRICAREEVLAGLLEVVRKDKVDGNLAMIFQHGHALHHQLQNEILPRLQVIVGQWRCQWCMKLHGGLKKGVPKELTLKPRPKRCRRCKKSDFVYNELSFYDEELRLSGHNDAFLKQPGYPGLGVGEFKSIGVRGGLEIRKAPNVGHVIQAQVYMMLSGCRWAKILYWQKSETGINALVEHTVEYDEGTVRVIRDMIRSIWKGLRDRDLPERICATDDCKRAKGCALKQACFRYGKVLPQEVT